MKTLDKIPILKIVRYTNRAKYNNLLEALLHNADYLDYTPTLISVSNEPAINHSMNTLNDAFIGVVLQRDSKRK